MATRKQPETFEELALSILKAQLSALVRNRKGAIALEDIEHLHKIRVALRRARLCSRLFVKHLPAWAGELEVLLDSLDDDLGPARDADVVVRLVRKRALKSGLSEHALAQLENCSEAWVAERQKQAVKALGSKEFDRIDHYLNLSQSAPETKPRPISVKKAGEFLDELEEQVQDTFETVKKRKATPRRIHTLRIAVRRYRYGLEFFKGTKGLVTAEKLKAVIALQDQLGRHHDLTLALGFLDEAGLDGEEFDAIRSWIRKRRKKAAPC